jgi:hypothetical protein
LAVIGCAWLVVGVSACSNGSPTVSEPSSASARATPSGTPAAFPPASDFSSPFYRYSVALPAGWRPQPAARRWDGTNSKLTNGSPASDIFFSQSGLSIWGASTQTNLPLDSWLAEQVRQGARRHPCATPRTNADVVLGGEPAVLSTTHCPKGSGTLVAYVAAEHGGRGYLFYYIHPQGLATNIDDVAEFHSVFDHVTFH